MDQPHFRCSVAAGTMGTTVIAAVGTGVRYYSLEKWGKPVEKSEELGIDREKGSIKLLGVNPPSSSSRFLTGIAVEMGPVEKFVLVSP